MDWKDVGSWLKDHAGAGASLVGALLTGGSSAAIAAAVSMVASATGEASPDKALQVLQAEPATMLKLREIASQEATGIREHIRQMAESEARDRQAEHHETQDTIREGDVAADEYVRRTRPGMARQSWYATGAYVILFEAAKGLGWIGQGASIELAALLATPALAYLGLRTFDKRAEVARLSRG